MLFCGNDTNLEVLGLTTEDGSYVTDAAIACAVKLAGATVATVTLFYLGTPVGIYADGNYRGVLPGSTALVAGQQYTLVYTASNYGLTLISVERAMTRDG